MRSPLYVSVLGTALLLAGCGAPVQVGLANAPVLGGATPETRVQDVIANGQDACSRSAFPPGHVLRGQTPPCITSEGVSPIVLLVPPKPRPLGGWASPSYPHGVCVARGPGLTGARRFDTQALAAASPALRCEAASL